MELMSQVELQKIVDEISKEYFHKPFIDDVRFNPRLRTTGGRYIPAKRLIELNPKYLLETDIEEFRGIIKHELCHYHLHIEGRGYKHGDADFKNLLKATNSPRFCKPLPSQATTYKYLYACLDCKEKYKRKRRVDIKKFRCGKCQGKLKLMKETVTS
ncbi:SprT family protein [Oceanobacillus sp. CAU 1775]